MLWTLDSKQPSAMPFIGSGNAMSTTVSAMQVHDNWLLAAGGTAGLLRYTIQEGAEPNDPESFTTGTAVALAMAWPNVVVADGTNGLVIVNADGPLALTGLGLRPPLTATSLV